MKLFTRPLISTVLIALTGLSASLAAQPSLSKDEKKTVADFQKRTQRYVDRREYFRGTLPKLSKDATPEQIEAHKDSLQKLVQADRVNTRQGDIFNQQIGLLIKAMIRREMTGWEKSELRKTVLEADTKIRLKVNTPYPESKELVEMPPPLLLSLPLLPKDLRYRFIGRSLAILDRDSALVIDYLPGALP
jgi:hypothetical protein